MARPKGAAKLPAVSVIPGNRGLNPSLGLAVLLTAGLMGASLLAARHKLLQDKESDAMLAAQMSRWSQAAVRPWRAYCRPSKQ
jgi:hypothetical protein